MTGDEALDAMIARAKALRVAGEQIAKEAAPLVEAALKKTAAAGESPDGKPWIPTKDGREPLAHAADAIEVKALGETVVVKVKGHHVFHQRGTGRLPKRPIIPEGGATIPEVVRGAMLEASHRVFERVMGAR